MSAVSSLCVGLFSALCLGCIGCDAPGRPAPGPEVPRPEQVLDFATLYKQNCAGCHGENGKNGAAISLANPVYLAIAGEATVASSHRQRSRRHAHARVRKIRGRHADRSADR